MLSLASGHDVGYLTGPVAGGREGYYTGAVDAGEPAGLWYGAGAEALGLRGEVDAELMEAVYSHLLDPRDPAAHSRAAWGEAETLGAGHRAYRSADEVYAGLLESNPHAGPERRAELRAQAERSARQSVAFIDATFSAPKSVSVLGVAFERAAHDARQVGDDRAADAWAAHHRAVEDAVLAGARASIDYLQDVAGYSRVGHHGGGGGRWVDAHRWVVAQFLQHDSRDRDPQLHVHQAILNRVLCADGRWRALDGRAIHEWRAAAAAIGERVMEAHLARSLGVRFETRPDGKAREVVGVRQEVIDLFSSRRRTITAKAENLVAAFTARFGREPSAAERDRLSRQATLATRAAKSHDGEPLADRLDRWERETRAAVAGGLAEVARHVLDLAQRVAPAAQWSVRDVVERALARVGSERQHYSRSDLTRAVSDELPGHVGVEPEQVPELLDGLTDTALDRAVHLTPTVDTAGWAADLLLANGEPVFSRPGSARFSTDGTLAAEYALRAAGVRRGASRFTAAEAAAATARFAESGHELGADQAAAVRGVLTSGARVETLVAAAGTGKSFTVAAISDAWTAAGHRVFGLAPSQVAAMVLAEEGVQAANTAAWLGAQRRLDTNRPGTPDPRGDREWRLRDGDLVVVDEAGMAATADLAAIHARCEAAGAKLLLVGDPRQLAAVGAGGALADLAERGVTYRLAEVRRFTAEWERSASLRFRDGDTAAVGEYAKHGRLVDGGTPEQAEAKAERRWLADTLAGRDSVLLVGSNEAAARASASLRAELVALGRVEEAGVALGREGWRGTVAGVGDLVQARRNGWELIGHAGNTRAPINRECYRVTGVRDDGGLTVAPVHGRDGDGTELLGEPITLPASYVAADLTLGYASTVHAAQGRTTDTAHAVVGAGTDAAGAYVAMTRGRDRNTVYAVTQSTAPDAAPGEAHEVQPRTARSVLTDTLEAAERERSALAQAEHESDAARSMMTHVDQLVAVVGDVIAGRTAAALDHLAAEGALAPEHRVALAADEAFDSLDRLLRTVELAGHDPDAVLRHAVAARGLDTAHSPAQVLHHRITSTLHGQLTPRVSSAADLIPHQVPDDKRAWLHQHAEDADDRRRHLGAQVAEAAPQWATDALGSVPADPLARADWEHKAGWAAAYRELADHTDDTDPLGKAPPAGFPEKAAMFRAAHTALDLLDGDAEEANLSDGRLRLRVSAYEREEPWAPRWVDDDLAAAEHAAQRARADAEVWSARAEAADDPTERERLRADAEQARREAEELAERTAALEAADEARAAWFAHTAGTRDNAHRARAELKARGVDLDDPDDRTTAEEWLAAHRAEQLEADADREVHDEHELADHDRGEPELPAADDAAETAVPDVRDTSTPDVTEAADPTDRHRVLTADETAAAVARAQAALAEIAARADADAARAARDAEDANRREELARWAADDRAAAAAAARDREDDLVRER